MKELKRHKRILVAGIMGLISIGFAFHSGYSAEAAEHKTAVFRLVATGDLHGKVTSQDYETNDYDAMCGLTKAATLIETARAEAGAANTMLVDAGDLLYDYSTSFFYDNYPTETQPILQALSILNYDFLTLGNHELDYPWDYLINQLEASGLKDKVVVSNLFWDADGTEVFNPSQLVTKTLTASDGTEVVVKIGVVGATRATLSTKRQRYGGFIYAEGIYENVQEEAIALRKAGADIIIAVVHGGIGVLTGSDTEIHPGARLASLPEIDAVVTAHTHEMFPLNDKTYQFYPSVDEAKGLVNGKPIVATGSYAAGIGLIDFNLSIAKDGTITIEGTNVSLRKVTEKTPENKKILKMFAPYEKKLIDGIDTTAYGLSEDTILTNMDCAVQDSSLFQMINNAKLQYANSYIYENIPKYKDYPVIAVTVNYLDNREPYIYIDETISVNDVASILSESADTRDSGYIYLYKITGKKLKEWLEYSASIYAKQGTRFEKLLKAFTERRTNVSTLLDEKYISDWSMLYLFDGINYQIDLSQNARYAVGGTMASSASHRIKNLTYNGVAVKDTQVFIIAMDALNVQYTFMPIASDSIYPLFPYTTGKEVILNYIAKQAENGAVDIKADNNWSLLLDNGYDFTLGTSLDSKIYVSSSSWYYKYIQKAKGLLFYWGKYKTTENKIGLVLSEGITGVTCQDIPIKVTVTGLKKGATVKRMLYLEQYIDDEYDEAWKDGILITDNIFNVHANETYTVLVLDSNGNKAIEHITIENIDDSIVDTPAVNLMTNRKTALTGTCVPGSTIYVEGANGILYFATTKEDGSFSVAIDAQRYNTAVTVWSELDGRKSASIEVLIRKTGPNMPINLETLYDGNISVHCLADSNETIYILKGKTVYVAEGQSEIYKKSEWYKATYKIEERPMVQNDIDGSYYLLVPPLSKGDKLYIYATDWQYRSSLRTTVVVQ